MSYDDEGSDPQPKRLIYDAREQVQAVRNEYWRQSVRGYVSTTMRRELATVAIQYYDVLSEHSEEKAINGQWDDSVETLREALGSTVEVAVQAPGDTGAVTFEERPAITQLDPDRIVQVTKQLDRIAKELGFGAQVREPTHHDEATLEHLGELTKARGQETAMDHLGVDPEPALDEDSNEHQTGSEPGADREPTGSDPGAGREDSGGPTVIDE
jgi:hypothetical protein